MRISASGLESTIAVAIDQILRLAPSIRPPIEPVVSRTKATSTVALALAAEYTADSGRVASAKASARMVIERFMVLLQCSVPWNQGFPRFTFPRGRKQGGAGTKLRLIWRGGTLGGRRNRIDWPIMESPARQVSLVPPPDRRQSETALLIARGTARLLRSLGFSCISELPLPSGRRADLVALNERGEIWIVEIKSSIEDLRADQKWQDYRMHCDRLFFAFTQDLPCELFPEQTGLIVADAYGAHMHCEAPEHRLPAPTRKLMTVRFAIAAAQRINRLVDPQGHGEF